MRSMAAFIKKEFMEQIRTYKCFIMLAVFFLFGMMSPLMAKLLPKLLSGMEMNGMVITLPEPTIFDAYGQFFKNINQMGMIILLLIFGGILSNELTKGTLINILAKGLSRQTVILSKFAAAVVLWTISFVLAALTNYVYSLYFFRDTKVEHLFLSLLCVWMFGILIISLILLASSVTSGSFGGLILSAMVLIILISTAGFQIVAEYHPIVLVTGNMGLIQGSVDPKEFIKPMWCTIIFTVGFLISAIKIFGKKKL